MSEAPKKILLGMFKDEHDPDLEYSQTYIRANLVDDLVEALEAVVRYAGCIGDDYLADQVRAALTKLKDD